MRLEVKLDPQTADSLASLMRDGYFGRTADEVIATALRRLKNYDKELEEEARLLDEAESSRVMPEEEYQAFIRDLFAMKEGP